MTKERTRSVAFNLVALVAAGLFVGCGGSSNGSSSSSGSPTASPSSSASSGPHIASLDACSVVSADLITRDLGTSMQGSGASSACTYSTADGKTALLVFGEVLPDTQTADAVQPDQLATQFNASFGISNAKPLNNVGDKAVEYQVTSGGQSGTIIFIFKSNVVMMLILEPSPSDTSGFETLAKDSANALH
jgi:hypothetical protein